MSKKFVESAKKILLRLHAKQFEAVAQQDWTRAQTLCKLSGRALTRYEGVITQLISKERAEHNGSSI